MTHYSQPGAAYRMSTGPPGRWTDPAEWRALGEDRARAGRIRARYAANAAIGFCSAWRQADSAADRHLGHADALDRIAAFTDEMTELLAVNRSSPNSLPEPDNASSGPAHSRTPIRAPCSPSARRHSAQPPDYRRDRHHCHPAASPNPAQLTNSASLPTTRAASGAA